MDPFDMFHPPPFPIGVRLRLTIMVLLILTALLFIAIDDAAAAQPSDAIESHKYADGVLLPRLTAALNDWAYQHPTDTPARPWEHVHQVNVGDIARYRSVREAFREWNEAMKRAGY